MFNILPKLEAEFPWLHTRTGTEEDFHEYTRRKNVEVLFRPDFPKGAWISTGDHHLILLNSALRGWELRYAMFHELGHYLFHVPTQSLSSQVEWCDPHVRKKQHLEAEQVAAVILLPISELENVHAIGADKEYIELADLIPVREELYKMYGK